jgi:translation initiation factor 1
MSKRNKPSKKQAVSATPEAKLSHNPFGQLSKLDAAVPEGESANESARPEPEPEPEPEPPLRFPMKLVVRMEKKGRRGKTVTRISGLPRRELKDLSVEMKKALGCGAMVEDNEVVLQGSLVDRASAWLNKQGAKQVVKGN